MKRLWLLRHGKSRWDIPDQPDHDRPLAPRGERASRRMARLMRNLAAAPDLVLCSDACRTRQTWALIEEDWSNARATIPPVVVTRELYECTSARICDVIATQAETARELLVIGHNPGLEDWLADLAGERHRLPTAALARVDFVTPQWSQLREETAMLPVAVWRPRELD